MNWIEHEVLRSRAATGNIIDFDDFAMKSDLPGNAIAGVGLLGALIAYFASHWWPEWFEQNGTYVWSAVCLLFTVGLLAQWQNVRARRDAYAAYLRPFSDERLQAVCEERFRYPATLSAETTDAAKRELDRRHRAD